MTLQLDARQRAILQEMGVRLFDPLPQAPVSPAQAEPSSAAPEQVARVPHVLSAAAGAPVVQPSAPLVRAPAAVPQGPLPVGAGVEMPAVESMDWATLADTILGCRACKLCTTRRHAVPGAGAPRADWLIVGEPPDEPEDAQGTPFPGDSGKLLDNMLRAAGLGGRDKVYIANVLRCRPPANRNPEPEELAQCEPYLRRQIELLQPRVILVMGRFAIQTLLQSQEPMGRLRGRAHAYQGVPVVVTYHPANLLRTPVDKAKAWADLCLAMDILDGVQPATIGR
jgi:uracil-DNA glycosylase family 4